MKLAFQHITLPENASYLVQDVDAHFFETGCHQNGAYKLVLFLHGSGHAHIGQNERNFGPGDLFFLNPEQPYQFQLNNETTIKALVIQFRADGEGLQKHDDESNKEKNFNRIIQYTTEKFQEPVTLSKIASIACMSIPSFCNYFKQRTQKTYFNYLNGVRVGYACNQLLYTNKTVTAICYESGFNTVTHFHRQFLRLKKTTPLQYRKQVNIEKAPLK